MGMMHLLNETGHSTLVWDETLPDTIEIAESEFEAMEHLGYVAFKRDRAQTQPAERIERFDPGADEILWLRPLQGG